jgi:peptidyl-prolyl cis-trans isomerase-like protein 2
VGGLETLSAIEKVETDNKDKPIEEILFVDAQIFADPFIEVDEILQKERAEEHAKLNEREENAKKVTPKPAAKLKVFREGVGRYIDPKRKAPNSESQDSSSHKKKIANYEFKNFNSW